MREKVFLRLLFIGLQGSLENGFEAWFGGSCGCAWCLRHDGRGECRGTDQLCYEDDDLYADKGTGQVLLVHRLIGLKMSATTEVVTIDAKIDARTVGCHQSASEMWRKESLAVRLRSLNTVRGISARPWTNLVPRPQSRNWCNT